MHGADPIKTLTPRIFFLVALLLVATAAACRVDTEDGFPTATEPNKNSYLEVVDAASDPVVELEAEVSASIDEIVTSLGDSTISGSASGTVISLNRKSRELADLAERAALTISRQSAPTRCKPFHEAQSEALRQIGQQAFDYANGTDIQGLSDPRLDLEAIDRGHRARLEARTLLSEATVLRAACER